MTITTTTPFQQNLFTRRNSHREASEATTHQTIFTTRRDPYSFRALRLENVQSDWRCNLMERDELIAKIFKEASNCFLHPHSEIQKLYFLKKISGFHQHPGQITLVHLAMNSLEKSQNPEIYSTMLYILKKCQYGDRFRFAHDIFLNAIRVEALSNYSIMHYLTIGMDEKQFEVLVPMAIYLREQHKSKTPSFLISNLIRCSQDSISPTLYSTLKSVEND